MMLNSVLLPLPFGPAMPKISPASTLNDTPSTAFSEPKAFDTSSSSSRAIPYCIQGCGLKAPVAYFSGEISARLPSQIWKKVIGI